MPTNSFAASDTISLDENIIDFLTELDILKKIKISDMSKNMSRAEFAAITVNAMNLQSSASDMNVFSDIAENKYASEICTLKNIGAVSSASDSFEPDRDITKNEAIKILVSALGYNNFAQNEGGWPYGYKIVASNIGLLKNISSSEFMNFADGLKIIFNFLYADLMLPTTVSGNTVSYESKKGENILSKNFGLKKITGILTSAGTFSCSSIAPSDKPKIEVNGELFDTKISGAEKLLGFSCDVWTDEDNARAVYKRQVNGTVSFSGDMVTEVSPFFIKAEKNAFETETFKLSSDLTFVKNGRLFPHNGQEFCINDADYLLIDNNGDGRYEIAVASIPEYVVAAAVNYSQKTVFDSTSNKSYSFAGLNGSFLNFEVYDFKSGESTKGDLSDISQGDLIEIYQSDDKTVADCRILKNNTIKAKITEISSESVFIGDKEYKINSYAKNNSDAFALNSERTFLLDSKGRLTYFDDDQKNTMKYGFLLGFQNKKSLSMSPLIRILDSSNERNTFELEEKILLDGESVKSDGAEISNKLVGSGVLNYQLIRYALNENNKIYALDTAEDAASSADLAEKYALPVISDNSLTRYVNHGQGEYVSNAGCLAPHCSVKSSVIFKVPKALTNSKSFNENNFISVAYSSLKDHESYIFDSYDYSGDFNARAVVIYSEDSAEIGETTITTPDIYQVSRVIESVNDALDENGALTKKLTVFYGGSFSSYIIPSDICRELIKRGLIPSSGDVVRIAFDVQGRVSGIAIDAEYNPSKKRPVLKSYLESSFGYRTYAAGNVFSFTGGTMSIKADYTHNSSALNDSIYAFVCTTGNVIIYDTKKNACRKSRLSDIVPSIKSGIDNSSYVLVRTDYGVASTIVIYE